MPDATGRRPLPRPFSYDWGRGQVIEEATVSNEWTEPTIQLLEYEDGSLSVRFCHYDHNGRFQRSPMLLGEADVGGLAAALESAPRLRALLRRLAG